jgi:hypothetical protein
MADVAFVVDVNPSLITLPADDNEAKDAGLLPVCNRWVAAWLLCTPA